jgi:hypothetical protein
MCNITIEIIFTYFDIETDYSKSSLFTNKCPAHQVAEKKPPLTVKSKSVFFSNIWDASVFCCFL